MGEGGFLTSKHYHDEAPSSSEMNIVSIIFGFCLGAALFTAIKAGHQTRDAMKRGRVWNWYITMVWLEWIGSNFMGLVTYLWLSSTVKPSFWVFFFVLVFWSMQIQFILQIIINRISVLMVPRSKATKLKIGVAILVGAINISGFCIWIPARLQVSTTFEDINVIWDRSEKAVFLVIDGLLNIYFIYLVRTRLIANGLQKYNRLFNFNIAMSLFSVMLDIVLMGATFLPSPVVYVQFHPLTYLLKLYIEMNIATLIAKVVKDTTPINYNARSDGTPLSDYTAKDAYEGRDNNHTTLITAHGGHVRLEDGDLSKENCVVSVEEGQIRKTLETNVMHQPLEEDRVSETTSTTSILY